jgi:flavin-binding protein dodecin
MDYESIARKYWHALDEAARQQIDSVSVDIEDLEQLLAKRKESRSKDLDSGLDALLARLEAVAREANPMSDLVTIRVGDIRRAIEQIKITAWATEYQSMNRGDDAK